MKNCLRLLFCFSVVMLLPVIAFAQNMVEASRLFQQGATFFTQNRNDDAIRALKASMDICQRLGNKPCIAMTASYLGGAHDRTGDYISSHRYHLTALHTFQDLNSTESVADSMNNVGIAHQKLKNYSLAIRYHDSALDIWKSLNNPAKIALSLGSNGDNYEKLGDLEKALSYRKEALDYIKRYNVRDFVVPAYFHVGTTCVKLKRNKEAEKYLNEALGLARSTNQTNWLALVGYTMASLKFETVRYDEALVLYEESLRNWRRMGDRKWEALTLNQIGYVKQKTGEFPGALLNYSNSFEVFRKISNEAGMSVGLKFRGSVLSDLGRYDDALRNFQEALTLSKKLGENRQTASLLNNIGVVYAEMGEREKAIDYYLKSVSNWKDPVLREVSGNEFDQSFASSFDSLSFEKDELYADTVFNNLGCSYRELGDFAKAVGYFQKAIEISGRRNDPDSQAVAFSNIGQLYLSRGDYANAEKDFQEELKAKKRAGLPWISGGLAEVYLNTGRASDALDMLDNARDDLAQPLPRLASLMTIRGLALQKLGRYREASKTFLKAVLMIEELRENSSYRESFLAGSRIKAYKGIVAALCERHLAGEQSDRTFRGYGRTLAEAAFYFAEMMKARTFLESMAGHAREISRSSLPRELRAKEQELLARLAALDRNAIDSFRKGQAEFEGIVHAREAVKNQLNDLITVLSDRYPVYAAVHYPRPVRVENIKLRDNQTLLSYVLAEVPYRITVTSDGKTEVSRLDVSTQKLEKFVTELLQPAFDGNFDHFGSQAAYELYKLLLPQEGCSTKELVIIPDGFLGRLPFEILVTRPGPDIGKNAYIGDCAEIVYEQSFGVLNLVTNQGESRYRKLLFAVGNPIFSSFDTRYKNRKRNASLKEERSLQASFRGVRRAGSPGVDEEIIFLPLPETENEVRTIAALYNVRPKPLDVLLDVAATEANVRRNSLRGYRYLHFATHAGLSGMLRKVNEPFLLLNQVGNTAPYDGFLTLTEVSNLQLDAEMVVLSACSTGKGEFIEGGGVTNLSRAFLLAGARSVMVSLWEAPSHETVTFMVEFYSKLKAGATRTEALLAARRVIRTSNPSPFYWGVFVMHGMM